jgi:translation initiation factor IF-1
MSKEEAIELEGNVVEAVKNGFIVKLESGDSRVFCKLGGKLYKNSIRVVPGDKVTIEVSPYDSSKGRIIRRER